MKGRFSSLKGETNIFKPPAPILARGRTKAQERTAPIHRERDVAADPGAFRAAGRTVPEGFDLVAEAFPGLRPGADLGLTVSGWAAAPDLCQQASVVKAAQPDKEVASRRSLAFTRSILRRMEERESRNAYLAWHRAWQADRNRRMDDGEKFYEPCDVDDVGCYSDSESDDDLAETEPWGR